MKFQKLNIMYIKAHFPGYVPVAKKQKSSHFGESFKHVQVIKMKNGQTRVIKHYQGVTIGGSK